MREREKQREYLPTKYTYKINWNWTWEDFRKKKICNNNIENGAATEKLIK